MLIKKMISTALTVTAACAVAHRANALGDFNGDGYDDIVVSVQGESAGTVTQAGAVHLFYGTSTGIGTTGNALIHRNSSGIAGTAQTDARLGGSVAYGDFNNDGYDDFAVGARLDDVGTSVDAGTIHLFYGSASGISSSADYLVGQNSTGVIGTAEGGDKFGAALTSGDFNGDGYDDLVVTVEGDSHVQIFFGGTAVLGANDMVFPIDGGFTLGAGDFNNDGFDDLVVGQEEAVVGGKTNAGKITVYYGASNFALSYYSPSVISQDRTGMDGISEENDLFGAALSAGDLNGDGYDDLAIGVPGELLYEKEGAGAVHVIYGSANSLTTAGDKMLYQGKDGLWGTLGTGDHFGTTIATGDFNDDGYADLSILVPGESVVQIVYGSASGPNTASSVHFASPVSVKDLGAMSPTMQRSLQVGDVNQDGYEDLLFGDPVLKVGRVYDAGQIYLLLGSSTGLNIDIATAQAVNQDTASVGDTAESGDIFGGCESHFTRWRPPNG